MPEDDVGAQPVAQDSRLTKKILGGNSAHSGRRRSKKRQKAPKPAEIIVPTPERRRRGEVELLPRPIADSRASYGQPYRSIDILASMFRRKAISHSLYRAGKDFQARFAVAQLVGMQATDFAAVRVSGARRVLLPERIETARDHVWRGLLAVGGIGSPGGSCLWHVLGLEEPVKQWALEHGRCSPAAASGVLTAALGVLAAPAPARRHERRRE